MRPLKKANAEARRRRESRVKNLRLSAFICVLFFLLLIAACRSETAVPPPARIVADGLLNPIGLAQLPDGGLLIAEMGTGLGDNSAGVTLLTVEGEIGRLIAGFPSTRDSGDLAGAPLVALSPDGRTLYTAHFNATHLWTLPLSQEPLTLPDEPLTTADLGSAMQPQVIDQLINPFDIAFDADGLPVVSDASMNGVARQTAAGKTHFIHLFPRLPHPTNGSRTIDAVPTGLARVGDEYFVTLTGGCPFPAGGGQLVAVAQSGRTRQVLTGLNMPIDVVQAADGRLWLLEFAEFREGGDCFAGGDYLPGSGRLSRLDENGQLQPAVTGLFTPGAFIFGADSTLYISEVFPGRVLALTLPSNEANWPLHLDEMRPDTQAMRLTPPPIATLTPWLPTRSVP